MYRFARRPLWIASHLLVLGLVVTMVALGLWQLRRLDERQAANAQLRARLTQPVAPLPEVMPAGASGRTADQAVDRQVRAEGSYVLEEQVLIRGRSLDDSPGSWVVVPLRLTDGRVLAVNRGWIPNDGRFEAVPERYEIPAGTIEVEGILLGSQSAGTFGSTDPPGRRENLARVDLGRLDDQVEGTLEPLWLQLTAEDPTTSPSPTRLDPPPLDDEGPHLSYAAQWFIFATIAGGGYPLILRRVARERAAEDGDATAPADRPDPDDPDPKDTVVLGDPRLDDPAAR